jgi:hypothetical protein
MNFAFWAFIAMLLSFAINVGLFFAGVYPESTANIVELCTVLFFACVAGGMHLHQFWKEHVKNNPQKQKSKL